MVTPKHTPKGRGYDSSLAYFSHANWMYSEREWLGSYSNRSDVPVDEGFLDLWDTDKPATALQGTGYAGAALQPLTTPPPPSL
jgi:arylsulfatase I/J